MRMAGRGLHRLHELSDGAHRRLAHRGIVESALNEAIEPAHVAVPSNRRQLHLARVARLEPHGRARRNVQPHPVRGLAIECEAAVHLEEMAVRSDLNRPIAAVAYFDAPRLASGIQLDG